MAAKIAPIQFELGKHGSFTFAPKENGGDNPAFYAQQIITALEEVAGRVPGAVAAITGVSQKGFE